MVTLYFDNIVFINESDNCTPIPKNNPIPAPISKFNNIGYNILCISISNLWGDNKFKKTTIRLFTIPSNTQEM